jgi:hypothetical protein
MPPKSPWKFRPRSLAACRRHSCLFRRENAIKRDEIAGRQNVCAQGVSRTAGKPVRIPDAVTKRAKKAGGGWEVEEF